MLKFSGSRNEWWFAGLVAGMLALGQTQEHTMSPSIRDSSEKPIAPANAGIAIHDGPPNRAAQAPGGPADALALIGTPHRFANVEQNSRLATRLNNGILQPRWQANIPAHFTPVALLAGRDRIVVEGTDSWLLIDGSGRILHQDRLSGGGVTLDVQHGLAYIPDPTGYISAHSLDDGRKVFHLSVLFDQSFRRALIERRGNRMVIVSVQGAVDPHGRVPPHISAVELQDLGEPYQLSDKGRLQSARQIELLTANTACLLPAMHKDTLALATDNYLYVAGLDLKVQRELTGEFHPLYLSLDEEPKFYLIVLVGSRLQLWVVKASGERLIRLALPEGFEPVVPPVIGFDHSVFLVGQQRVLGIGASGNLKWDHALKELLVGAAVTSDDHLLVTTDVGLDDYDKAGHRRRIFKETLSTAPAATDRGDILIAGRHRIYCLIP